MLSTTIVQVSLAPEIGRLVGGRYRLEKILGEGGMAVVWRAVHTETDRAVAVKLVRQNLLENDQARDLFVRESRIAARIGRSDHIVDVLDAGVDADLNVPFLVMELLQGEALDARLKRDGPLKAELALRLVEQLGEALDQAHDAGVIHRDLKPQNLFLSQDRKGRTICKILDFGIAKLSETAQSSATQIGTPAYSAPEQLGESWRAIAAQNGGIIASTVTARTDVWAYGLVVYEMLSGAGSGSIWAATTLAELPVKIVLEPTPTASKRAGENARLLPPGFDAWLARCLALDADARWSRAGDAAKALVPLLAGFIPSAQVTRQSDAGPQNPSVSSAPPRGHTPIGEAATVSPGRPQSTPPAWSPSAPPPAAPYRSSYSSMPEGHALPSAGYTNQTYARPSQAQERAPGLPSNTPYPQPSNTPYPQALGNPWQTRPPIDPQLQAWVTARRCEIRPGHLGELKSFEPWIYLPATGRVGNEVLALVDEGRARVAEVYGADVISQAMGEERRILAIVSSPRVRYRVALRSKVATGFAEEIGRGLRLLDGLVSMGPANAKSIGDSFLESHFDVSSPSAGEGHAALGVPLRQLLVHGGFRGTLEMKPGALAVSHQSITSLDPGGLDFLLNFLIQVHRALTP